MPVTEELLKAASEADVSLVIIGRTAGEDQDNSDTEGSYRLQKEEENLIKSITEVSRRTVVLINSGNIIDMSWVNRYHPQGVLYVWQGGQKGGNGVADILIGRQSPSGKLTDTIAEKITDYPSTENFGEERENIYKEDIFVGYRYFETFSKDKVLYPFGYGLSYTSFSITSKITDVNEKQVHVCAKVKNVGNVAGKEVVQVYISAPQGVLGKPQRQLVGFAKTKLLSPEENQEMELVIDKYMIASYDEVGITGNKSCYVLEAGTYELYAGNDVRSAGLVGSSDEKYRILYQLQPVCVPKKKFPVLYAQTDENGKLHLFLSSS